MNTVVAFIGIFAIIGVTIPMAFARPGGGIGGLVNADALNADTILDDLNLLGAKQNKQDNHDHIGDGSCTDHHHHDCDGDGSCTGHHHHGCDGDGHGHHHDFRPYDDTHLCNNGPDCHHHHGHGNTHDN